jgi:microcystin-dependent protein
MWSAAPDVPVGWLLCDGRLVTVGDHPALAAYIGDTYGGDGITTIGLPDLIGRFVMSIGDPGRENFTYQDGINKEHVHGMFANQTHTHNVTDPGHEHPTSSGSHSHSTTSVHSHPNTTDHKHFTPGMATHSYVLIVTCNREVYAPDTRFSEGCSRDPGDFFETVISPAFNIFGKTGITMVNANVTGTTVEIAYTGVTLATQFTGITLQPAQTGMSVDRFGVVGGPRPKNIALLPIIRT